MNLRRFTSQFSAYSAGGAASGPTAVSGVKPDPQAYHPAGVGRALRRLALAVGVLVGATSAQAQWETVTYHLKGGWNAIYLHGEADYASLETIFPESSNVISVWRWNPNPNPIQIGTSSVLPTTGTPEWQVWTRAEGDSDSLDSLPGQSAYLVECSGSAGDSSTVTITQRVLPPRYSWVRNGANLLGFPSRLSGNYPLFSTYFATFPVATASNSKIYKYDGGPLGPGNPIQVFSPSSERLDRTKAYWFEAPVVGNFYAPLEVTPSRLDGLHYGRTGSLITVRVRNRTASALNLTVSPVTSAAAPVGEEAIAAPVPLTFREFDTGSSAYVFNAVSGDIPVTIGPQSAVELSFGVDRSQIVGSTDSLYASLLRFTDGGNLMDVTLPVSARVSSMAGLWVGEALVSEVQSHVPGAEGTGTGRDFPLRLIVHVADDGTARLLSQVFIGTLTSNPNAVGLATVEGALLASDKANAQRLSVAHLPPDTVADDVVGSGSVAIGQTLTRTITIGFNAPTNPYVHTYHPDHDNRNARFDAMLPAGEESPTITRAMSFAFTASPPEGTSPQGWGSSVIGGDYTETLSGLRRAKMSDGTSTTSITVSGTFILRRVSELGSITTTAAP
ncbi:hypothetical protein [Actomonas aquatica]|uniref:Ig-like domain-containing protein n=1 Tax=Actomonas aquatica TaxID=2866162 RepID=A0ABZ1C4R5_9BACT|nr:hypothetical protein [Opitutus sp. WL0086]WRQ86714.1 hypothetical protein K1X11_018025 [Opitutus sp. WL0086]